MKLTKAEIKVIISLIDSYQFDGAWWTFGEGKNKVHLNTLKRKLKDEYSKLNR